MNKHLLAGASMVALMFGATSAFAADLGRPITKAPAMVAAPVYTSWTGFYIGGQVGYQYGYIAGYHPDGIVGGGHIGFNYQTGPVVFGIEADAEAAGVRKSHDYYGYYDGYSYGLINSRFDERWQSSVRGRLGFTAGNQMLIYATGGVAFGGFRNTGALAGITYNSYDNTVSRTGYTVGAGIEYKFTPNFSGRVEYRYTDFGSIYNAHTDTRPKIEFSTVRVGLSYYFGGFGGGGGPVVAAY